MKLLLTFFGFFISLAGSAQLITDSVKIDGYHRTFHFNKPASRLKSGNLLFVLHGSGGSGLKARDNTGKIEAIREKENLLIIYPDGYKNYWNECRKKSTAEANTLDINEQGFFLAMIDYFKANYGISEKKVFVVGTSGGGHMAYKLAMTIPEHFRAIAAVIANIPDSVSTDCKTVNKAVPVLIINGTADNVNPYNGGEMFVNNANFGSVQSTTDNFNYWARLAGYKGEPVWAKLPDTDLADGRTIESYTFKEKGKPEIQLLKVNGGKHDYPKDIDVYLYAWGFFKRQGER